MSKRNKIINILTILIVCIVVGAVIIMVRPAKEEQAAEQDDGKSITVNVAIDCSAVLEDKNYEQLAQAVKDSGLLDGGGRLAEGSVTIPEGGTAMDALRASCAGSGLSLDIQKSDFDGSMEYVYGIGGLNQGDCTKNSGWVYSIDGESPDVGLSDYTVSEGSDILVEFILF